MFLDLRTFSPPGDPQPLHPAAGRHRLHNGARHHGLGQVRGAVHSPNLHYSKGSQAAVIPLLKVTYMENKVRASFKSPMPVHFICRHC